jgi:hypothetical protein
MYARPLILDAEMALKKFSGNTRRLINDMMIDRDFG